MRFTNSSSHKLQWIWIVRIVLGAVFVFSGFVKAVDPWGGLFKIQEYFGSWGIAANHEICLLTACALSAFEFLLGVSILLGCFRKLASWSALIFMAIMTVLTLYVWIADPVADCGCFGDAFKISNSLTFCKNVVLLVLSVVLFKYNAKLKSLIYRRLQWLAMTVTAIYVVAIQAYGYQIQPLLDFRAFPVGTNLYELLNDESDSEFEFIYEKDGRTESFSADNIPDESWTFVRREERNSQDTSPVLSIFDGEDDISADLIEPEGYQYLLLVSDPERYGISRSEMANNLYDYANNHNAEMAAIVAVDPDNVDEWKSLTDARYPVYTAEDTDLKILARGDAAIVALKDGVIRWKTNVFALAPDFPEGQQSVNQKMIEGDESPLAKFTVIWLFSLFVIYLLSAFIYTLVARKNRKAQQDEAAQSDTDTKSTE